MSQFQNFLRTVFKTMWCYKDRHIDQWNTSKALEINSYISGQLIFARVVSLFNGGNNLPSANDSEKIRFPHEVGPLPHTIYKKLTQNESMT